MSKEYPCIYHKNGECNKYSGDGVISYCVLGPCPDETPSNADRIRAMTDEALAKIIESLLEDDVCMHYSHAECSSCDLRELCAIEPGQALHWLCQPANRRERVETELIC